MPGLAPPNAELWSLVVEFTRPITKSVPATQEVLESCLLWCSRCITSACLGRVGAARPAVGGSWLGSYGSHSVQPHRLLIQNGIQLHSYARLRHGRSEHSKGADDLCETRAITSTTWQAAAGLLVEHADGERPVGHALAMSPAN